MLKICCFLPLQAPHGTVPCMGFPADVRWGPGLCMNHPDALKCRCRSPRSFPGLLGPTLRGPVPPPCLTCQSTGPGLSGGRCR